MELKKLLANMCLIIEHKKNTPEKKSRKLIGSMKRDKILLYAPLLKWYLEHDKRQILPAGVSTIPLDI